MNFIDSLKFLIETLHVTPEYSYIHYGYNFLAVIIGLAVLKISRENIIRKRRPDIIDIAVSTRIRRGLKVACVKNIFRGLVYLQVTLSYPAYLVVLTISRE